MLLVEDNEVYRSTLELLLDGRDGIEVVGAVADGRAAPPRLPSASTPTSSLMDFRLPGLDGAAATAAVRACAPDAAVLCLTAEATETRRRGGARRRSRRLRREGRADRRELVRAS